MRMCITTCFFFPAEHGIRVHCVTGVQTCALPISSLDAEAAVGVGDDGADRAARAGAAPVDGGGIFAWLGSAEIGERGDGDGAGRNAFGAADIGPVRDRKSVV